MLEISFIRIQKKNIMISGSCSVDVDDDGWVFIGHLGYRVKEQMINTFNVLFMAPFDRLLFLKNTNDI